MSRGTKEHQEKEAENLKAIMLEIEADKENWIKVEDELPEDYDDYLTCYKGTISIRHYNGRGFQNHSGIVPVEYWRELPEPPNEK